MEQSDTPATLKSFKVAIEQHMRRQQSDEVAKRLGAALSLVVGLLQSLGGHVHGDHVLHALARGDAASVEVVECSLTATAMAFAPAVLQAAGCHVTGTSRRMSVRAPAHSSPIAVELSTYSSMLHAPSSLPPTVFDWQHLVSCRTRLYMRRQTGRADVMMLPPIETLLCRARLGKFCLSDGCPSSEKADGDQIHGKAMCRAARLVLERGWSMDDMLAGRHSWVASRWDAMQSARCHDQPLSNLQPPIATTHDHCPICYERFCAADVVVNLPCNHNFHAACHSQPTTSASGGGGICAWLAAGQHSCPCCRAEVFTPPHPV